jgi:hypothetical protein
MMKDHIKGVAMLTKYVPLKIVASKNKISGLTETKMRHIISLAKVALTIITVLSIVGLYIAVISVILYTAVSQPNVPNTELLNTVLALVANAMSAVLGYIFGRYTSRHK